MKWRLQALVALMLTLLLIPKSVLAQEYDWRERSTDRFAILYIDGDQATAERYAGFVDSLYDEVALIFGYKTKIPVILRLYPSLARYQQVNPLARGLTGIVAHADFRLHEVVVILPQTASQTQEEIRNNIRHELTHIVAAELSDDRLNVGLQEGLAQYIEHPAPELDRRITLLSRAFHQDQLLPWSAMDDRDTIYQNPEIGYPESLSVVAFLIDRYGFAKMRDFLTISANSSGYRSALERTYGATPDVLEQQWKSWLPNYITGGYKRNALSAYDLSGAELLLRQGRYAAAKSELDAAIEWLRTTEQDAVLQQAHQLLEQSLAGIQAEQLVVNARAALAANDYEQADILVIQARQAYANLNDTHQDTVLMAYADRIARGRQASEQFNQALNLARSLQYPQARAITDQATSTYLALGDRTHADQALALRTFLDQRQTLLGAILLILGIVGAGASVIRRLTVSEAELW